MISSRADLLGNCVPHLMPFEDMTSSLKVSALQSDNHRWSIVERPGPVMRFLISPGPETDNAASKTKKTVIIDS